MKAKLSFLYNHHFKFPNRNTGFISRSTNVNVKMHFPIVILKLTLVLMCLKVILTLSSDEK